MRKIATYIKPFLLSTLLLVLFLPMLQNVLHLLEKTYPLKGDVQLAGDMDFEKHKWFNAEYQEQKEKYVNDNFGFRSLFVRLNNQIAYSLFHKPKAKGVIIGKENYLYEESYINAYTGKDYLGDDSIQHTINRLTFINDTLKKLNKHLVIVFAAGKASFYPEFIPDKYLPILEKTNYKSLSSGCNKAQLNVIDFNKWFVENKKTSPYPLYPQQGVHWSTYGTALAADSLIKKIETLQHIHAPHLLFKGVTMQQAHDVDYDIADGMNLLFKIKGFDVAYPNMLTIDATNKVKPKVLVISDSFYWGMYNLGIANCFQGDHFWYYNKQVYPESFTKETFAEDQDLKTTIDSHDVIVIMATEATLRKISWGFIERLEQHFKGIDNVKTANLQSPEYKQKVQNAVTYIKTQTQWMIDAEQRALEKKISLDSSLVLEAMWLIDSQK